MYICKENKIRICARFFFEKKDFFGGVRLIMQPKFNICFDITKIF